jgi:translation initiation factor 2 beta subunit (eIF-2beta)/eIF-5
MINVNNSDDLFYRYKMEKVNITNKGFGNGLFTIINNLESIAKSINTPVEILYKYIANDLGSNYNEKKKSMNGNHTHEKIQESIYKYINDFVICNKCGIPEVNYFLEKKSIEAKCSACGKLNEIKNNNKINQKNVDIILKYLEKNKVWLKTKGNMVLQEKPFFNKFDAEEFGKEIDNNTLNKLEDTLSEEADTDNNFNPFN